MVSPWALFPFPKTLYHRNVKLNERSKNNMKIQNKEKEDREMLKLKINVNQLKCKF